MKGLFIIHSKSIFGGERSLATLLKSYTQVDQELLLSKIPILNPKRSVDWQMLFQDYYSQAKYQGEFFLPFTTNFYGPNRKLKSYCNTFIKNLFWLKNRKDFYHLLRKEKYSFIHLNSFSIASLVTDEFPFIVHIREIVKKVSNRVVQRLKRAKGIIFIDETTFAPFKNITFQNSLILNNPFDMTHVKNCSPLEEKKNLNLPQNAIIFTILANFIEIKGIKELIKAFLSVKQPNCYLLIVGPYQNAYGKECQKLAKNDLRIRFLGSLYDTSKIYSISDYIIRNEPFFAVGRTVLEGLYCDCDIIMPGSKTDIESHSILSPFQNKIHTFTPKDSQSLLKVLQSYSNKPVQKKSFRSNVTEYVNSFHNFILRCTEKKS